MEWCPSKIPAKVTTKNQPRAARQSPKTLEKKVFLLTDTLSDRSARASRLRLTLIRIALRLAPFVVDRRYAWRLENDTTKPSGDTVDVRVVRKVGS